MKKMNKLVALLLAAVMVLGMMPTVSVHAHAHGAEVLGIEEYPALALDTEAAVNIEEYGQRVYFTFTPEVTDLYHFYSLNNGYSDTYGHLYDADMNELAWNDDAPFDNSMGIANGNFCISYMLEAGKTYVLCARLWSAYTTATFSVKLIQGHEYESVVTKEASCESDGIRTYTCAHCGDTYEEAIPAAHSYGDDGNCIHCGAAYLITGTCGENVTWSLDWFGKLTISGTGDMDDYTVSYSESNPSPWYNDYNSQIKSVVIEDGITSVGNYAFYQCRNLVSVTMTDSVVELGNATFNNCDLLTDVELSDSITQIPSYCFNYCPIAELDWPASLTSIANNAFAGAAFGNLVLPEGLTFIGQNAFRGCNSMKRLTLPTTLTTLDNYAFDGMWNTTEYIFTGDAPTFGNYVFNYARATVWYPLGNETWTTDLMQNYGGTLTWKGICTGTHTYGEAVTVPAECEKGSYMTMSCTVCGYTQISPENDDALGHDFQYSRYDGGCGDSAYDIVTCSRCDYYTTENWVWNDHSYEPTLIPATCEEEGYTLNTCTTCGDSYQSNWTSALGHNVSQWGETTEATCEEDGVRTGDCQRCSKTVTEIVTPALGHDWDKDNGTENEDGTTTYPCKRCDATYTTEGSYLYVGDNHFSIDAGDGSKTKFFNAETDGVLTITISDLYYYNNYSGTWNTLALDWVFSEGFFNIYVNGTNSTYTVVGSEASSEVVLTAVDVKAGDTVTVEVNQIEDSYYYRDNIQFNMNLALEGEEPAGMIFELGDNELMLPESMSGEGVEGTWTAAKDGTLTVKLASVHYHDEFMSSILGLYWLEVPVEDALSNNYYTLEINGLRYSYESGIVTVDVNAGDTVTIKVGNNYGYESKAVVNLAFEGSAPIVPVGPTLVMGDNQFSVATGKTSEVYSWVAEEDTALVIEMTKLILDFYGFASEESPAFYLSDRSISMKINGESVYTAKNTLELKAGDVITVQLGNTTGFDAQITVNLSTAADHTHSFGDWTITKEATCTEDGAQERTCQCGEKETEVIPALGHTEAEAVKENEKAATCTEKGSYDLVVYCERCDVELSRETVTVDALGHEYEVYEIVPPTCSKSGYTVYKCIRCDKTYKDDPVEPEHKFDNGTVTAPTCTEMGYTTYTCTVCSEKYVDEASWVPATGHDWDGTSCKNCDEKRENPFVDVDEVVHKSFLNAILWASEEGITTGTDASHFNPSGTCMRGHVVTFLWRAMGEPEPTITENPFVDVDASAYYYKAVLWAYEKGITTGIDATHFNPTGKCNRAQVVTFLWRAVGKPDSNATESGFTDVTNPKEFYYDAVLWAVENGITNGMGDGTFGVLKTCNRAQVVTFLYRTFA